MPLAKAAGVLIAKRGVWPRHVESLDSFGNGFAGMIEAEEQALSFGSSSRDPPAEALDVTVIRHVVLGAIVRSVNQVG